MRELNHKLKTGRTLKRVREIRERLARQHVAQANAKANASAVEEEQRREELQTVEHALQHEAGQGMSMKQFMRYQGLREMHVVAVNRAQVARRTADQQVSQQRTALLEATTRRRTADRLVSLISAQRVKVVRRLEQKQADDMTCARHGQGGIMDHAA
ncbi:MAG: flagellar FliJ family protein [Myxococcota bacterium]